MNFKFRMFFMLLIVCSNLFAQSDASSKLILDALSKKIKTYDLVKTEITFTVNNLETKSNESQVGVLYLKSKANKYKLIFQNQEILSDGKNQWTYLKADNEVQLNTVNNEEDALSPAQIFTSFNKGFKSKYNGETKIGTAVYQNIELAPIATKSFFKIKLAINKAKNQIYSVSIYNKNGINYTYTINKLTALNVIGDSFFVWDKKKYPNVNLEDLR